MIVEASKQTNRFSENGSKYQGVIRNSVQTLLHCGNDVGAMKQAVDELYRVFRSISPVAIDDQNTPDIFLPSGKAISPEKAAHCLLEMKRTAIFVRGIYKAIQSCLNDHKRPVRLLYAGTGPYATLVIPLLTLFNYEQLQVDLVEINKKSLTSVMNAFNELRLFGFVDHIYFDDAATLTLERKYDIVVAEVMQAALKKEPQVAVMQNIVGQLGTSVIFIPEEVKLSATIFTGNEPSPENDWTTDNKTIQLGNIFRLDKFSLQTGSMRNTLRLPACLKENNQLFIHTSIRAFADEQLLEGDCSLTLPVKVCRFKRSNADQLSFWYELGATPGVRCRLGSEKQVYEALGSHDHTTDL